MNGTFSPVDTCMTPIVVTPRDSQNATGVALILDAGNLERSRLPFLLTGQPVKRPNTARNSTHAHCCNPSTDCVQGVENGEGGG